MPVTSEWTADPAFRELVRRFTTEEKDKPSSARAAVVVGIAVWPENFERIRAAHQSPPLAQVPPDQDAVEFELEFEGDVRLDILTSRDPKGSGAIARYLQKFGEGIQQIEIDVADVDRVTQILQARFGVRPVYPATRPGANGTRVNFFLVSVPAGGNVLIELVEAPAIPKKSA